MNMTLKAMLAAACIGLLAVSVACGGGKTGSAAPAPPIAPTITSQPSDKTGIHGNSVTFSVTATGLPAPGFQWRKGGHAIVGATGSTLLVSPVKVDDDGTRYDVIVHNDLGNVTSNVAILHVQNVPGNVLVKFVTTQAGTITGSEFQSIPAGGSTTAVSAVPATAVHPPNPWSTYNPDTTFFNWTGPNGFISSDNPLVLTGVQADMTIQANYTGGRAGCMMTDITGIDATGADTALSNDKGSVLVMEITKGDNPYSQANAPVLEALFQKYKDQGLKVVTVFYMEDSYSYATPSQIFLQTWVATYGLHFKVMSDTTLGTPWGGVGQEIYGAAVGNRSPVLAVFDKNGVNQLIQAGLDKEAVEAKVMELLAQ